MIRIALAVMLLTLAPVPAFGATYRCDFGPGTQASWDHGEPTIKSADHGAGDVVFDSIDTSAGTARFIGNSGAVDIVVVMSGAGLTFVETTGLGNLVFTTIFWSKAGATDRLVAVTSRHMDINGPFPSQYHGTCAELD